LTLGPFDRCIEIAHRLFVRNGLAGASLLEPDPYILHDHGLAGDPGLQRLVDEGRSRAPCSSDESVEAEQGLGRQPDPED